MLHDVGVRFRGERGCWEGMLRGNVLSVARA